MNNIKGFFSKSQPKEQPPIAIANKNSHRRKRSEKSVTDSRAATSDSISGRKSRQIPSRISQSHFDCDTHPLNLPPEERRRYSDMAAMADTPTPIATPDTPQSPQQSAPGAFPTTNGENGSDENEAPQPPPHQSPKSPQEESAPAVDPEACKAAGNKFFKAKQFDKAIAEYTKAVVASPDSATYRSNRAAAFMSANRFQDALQDAKAADDLEPNSDKILRRLARVYTSLGQPQDALDTYAKIQPPASATDQAVAKNMLQHINQAESQLKEGKTGSMALHALDQAERNLGTGVSKPRKWRLMRGEAFLNMGNENALGDAQNVAMGLLRENNQDPEALVLRGRAMYAQGDNEKAIQHFRKAMECDPDFKDGVKYLRMVQKLDRMKEEGNSLFKSAKYQDAVQIYTQALEVDPANKGTNAKLLQNRALCHMKVNSPTHLETTHN